MSETQMSHYLATGIRQLSVVDAQQYQIVVAVTSVQAECETKGESIAASD